MIEAVIFDRDGVLADFKVVEAIAFFDPLLPISIETLSERWEAWGQEVGFPKSIAEEKIFFDTFWNYICDELALPETTRQTLLQFDYADYMQAFADAAPTMQYARAQALKIGVLSNFSLASLEHSLDAIGLLNFVDCACAATVIGAAKPSPESYLTVCRELNVDPKACIYLDDETECVNGAREVGMSAYEVDRARNSHDLSLGIIGNLDIVPEILMSVGV